MIYAIIVAGGVGNRAGFNLPKQFVRLNGKTILKMTVEKFQNSELIDKFIIVSHKDFFKQTEEEVREFSKFEKIIVGGESRQKSVFNGLLYLAKKNKRPKIVCIHDAVRPFVEIRKIDECINKAKETGGAILAEKAENTVSQVSNQNIEKIFKRSQIFLHHTPQSFDFEKLLESYQKAKTLLSSFTDDASIFLYAGFQVTIVEDYKNNIKLTTKSDFEWAESFLRHKGLK